MRLSIFRGINTVVAASSLVLVLAAPFAGRPGPVPGLVNYQGKLTDSGGTPVTASVPMLFSLWDGETAGVILWSEARAVEVSGGLYGVMLGDSVAIPPLALSGATVFLQVTVMGETLFPRERLTAVPYAIKAGNADLLDSLDSTDFAPYVHFHDFSEITGTVTDAQIPDNITIIQAQNSTQLNGLAADAYVLVSGDSVTGSLQINQQLLVQGSAAVLGGNIGLGMYPSAAYGIINDPATAPSYGADLSGSVAGIIGRWASDPTDHYGLLGSSVYGAVGMSGNSDETSVRYGGRFGAQSQGMNFGVYASGNGYGGGDTYGIFAGADNSSTGTTWGGNFSSTAYNTQTAYGVYGYADNSGSGDVYGGYFTTEYDGSGNHYGVYAESDQVPLWARNSYNSTAHQTWLATPYTGVTALSGDSSETGLMTGAFFYAISRSGSYGARGYAESYGPPWAYGLQGSAEAGGGADAYGVDSYALSNGGSAYGYNAYVQNYAGDAYGLYAYTWAAGGGTAYALYSPSGVKSWVNPDPEDATKSVAYVTVESGENVTYYAGRARLTNGRAEIALPDHFRKVTSPDYPVMVQLTPRSLDSLGLAAVESDNAHLVVGELMHGQGNYEFDYTVKGMRLGYEDYQPVIDNKDYVPFQGNLSAMDDSRTTTQEFYDHQSSGLKKILERNRTLDKNGKVIEANFQAHGWKEVKSREPRPEGPGK